MGKETAKKDIVPIPEMQTGLSGFHREPSPKPPGDPSVFYDGTVRDGNYELAKNNVRQLFLSCR